jgi:hypothetical protein
MISNLKEHQFEETLKSHNLHEQVDRETMAVERPIINEVI